MKKARYTEEQTVVVLRETDRTSAAGGICDQARAVGTPGMQLVEHGAIVIALPLGSRNGIARQPVRCDAWPRSIHAMGADPFKTSWNARVAS